MTTWFLEQERGGLDGARQRQHVEAARPLQRPGAGLGGRSGSDHVVDHHDLFYP